MVVVVFRSRVSGDSTTAFQALADKMFHLAKDMPGFISYKVYTADDGERVSIHEWASAEHLRAWREHPDHARAQQAGRDIYYAEYTSYVCENPRTSRFPE